MRKLTLTRVRTWTRRLGVGLAVSLALGSGMTGVGLLAADAPNATGGTPAAAQGQTPAAAIAKAPRVVVLGDSITAGYGLDPAEAYPALLQKKAEEAGIPATIVNAGISGDTTAGGLRRVAWALSSGADVLVVALGGNDGLRGISPQQTQDNLKGIIAKAREKSPKVKIVIAGMQMPENMGKEYVERFAAVFPAVAKEQQAALVPFLLEGVGGDEKLNQADRIHPTAEGQKRVADNVWKVLEKVVKGD